MHPVPVGETGEARSKGQGEEGNHPACTTTGRKAGETSPWGNASTLAPRQGQRPLARQRHYQAPAKAPQDRPRGYGRADQRWGRVGHRGGGRSAEPAGIRQSAAAG